MEGSPPIRHEQTNKQTNKGFGTDPAAHASPARSVGHVIAWPPVVGSAEKPWHAAASTLQAPEPSPYAHSHTSPFPLNKRHHAHAHSRREAHNLTVTGAAPSGGRTRPAISTTICATIRRAPAARETCTHTSFLCVAVACVRAYVCVCLHRCVRACACVHVSACMRAHALACMRRFFPVKEEARLETRRVRMGEVMTGTKKRESGGGWAGGWVRAG